MHAYVQQQASIQNLKQNLCTESFLANQASCQSYFDILQLHLPPPECLSAISDV